jgi:hypothetical protein
LKKTKNKRDFHKSVGAEKGSIQLKAIFSRIFVFFLSDLFIKNKKENFGKKTQ